MREVVHRCSGIGVTLTWEEHDAKIVDLDSPESQQRTAYDAVSHVFSRLGRGGENMGIILALLGGPGASGSVQPPSEMHVRSEERITAALVADGLARSATFDCLVTALNRSDVVVYIRSSLTMGNGFDGYLVQRVRKEGGRRYLHVVVNPRLERHRLISVIAHELQHAWEVAQVPAAESDAAIDALFRRLDTGCYSTRPCTETDAGWQVQERVFRELRGLARSPDAAVPPFPSGAR
jgi:hypothetical protein